VSLCSYEHSWVARSFGSGWSAGVSKRLIRLTIGHIRGIMSHKNKCAIKPEPVQLLRQLAAQDRITMAEVIERALDLYARREVAKSLFSFVYRQTRTLRLSYILIIIFYTEATYGFEMEHLVPIFTLTQYWWWLLAAIIDWSGY
jgi:hypothetical protein